MKQKPISKPQRDMLERILFDSRGLAKDKLGLWAGPKCHTYRSLSARGFIQESYRKSRLGGEFLWVKATRAGTNAYEASAPESVLIARGDACSSLVRNYGIDFPKGD